MAPVRRRPKLEGYAHARPADLAVERPRHRWIREEGSRYRCTACARVTQSMSVRVITASCKGTQETQGSTAVMRQVKRHRFVAIFHGDLSRMTMVTFILVLMFATSPSGLRDSSRPPYPIERRKSERECRVSPASLILGFGQAPSSLSVKCCGS